VSLEVSPLLAYDTAKTIAAAKELFERAGRPNLFIKIPGMVEGLPAIEEAIFAGVLARFAKAGVDVAALAAKLQSDGAKSFVDSWNELMAVIGAKSESLRKTG
jgi:transaldolase